MSYTTRSLAAQDGWILETGENTNMGGAFNATDPTFKLGDDSARKQYRAVLSFNTSGLPDTAVITKVTLTLTRQTTVPTGTSPFAIFHGLLIDVRKGFFGSKAAIEAADFQAVASKAGLGPFMPIRAGATYTFPLPSTAFPYINKTYTTTTAGLTQLRLRFNLDDNNNNIANFISFFSGNAGTADYRPTLIIRYYVP